MLDSEESDAVTFSTWIPAPGCIPCDSPVVILNCVPALIISNFSILNDGAITAPVANSIPFPDWYLKYLLVCLMH